MPGDVHGNIDDDHHRSVDDIDNRGIYHHDHNGVVDPVGRAADPALWQREPTMENFALMTLLDSTTASQTAYGDLLTKLSGLNRADSTNPAATETWPFPSTGVVGGDEATLGKIVGLVGRARAPPARRWPSCSWGPSCLWHPYGRGTHSACPGISPLRPCKMRKARLSPLRLQRRKPLRATSPSPRTTLFPSTPT